MHPPAAMRVFGWVLAVFALETEHDAATAGGSQDIENLSCNPKTVPVSPQSDKPLRDTYIAAASWY